MIGGWLDFSLLYQGILWNVLISVPIALVCRKFNNLRMYFNIWTINNAALALDTSLGRFPPYILLT